MTPEIQEKIKAIELEKKAMAAMICPDCGNTLDTDYWNETSPFYDLKCYYCGFYARDSAVGHQRTRYNRNPRCKCCGYKFEDKFTSTYCGMCDSWAKRFFRKLLGFS